MPFPFAEVEKRLGYVFKNKALLKTAFTHSTYANSVGVESNERMEYFGDAVLQMVVTEWLYFKDENAAEGKLTGKRQKLVCKDALDSATDGLGVWEYLLAVGSEYNVKGKAKSSLFEAIVAAIYLDGGYGAAKKFILEHGNLHLDVRSNNSIGELKEFLEKRGKEQPKEKWEKSGSDNAPHFKCELFACGQSAKGEGKTKREAKATAAARLLWEIKK